MKRTINAIACCALSVLMVLTLSGCALWTTVQDPDTASSVAINYLDKKYGEQFECVKDMQPYVYSDNDILYYYGTFAPVSDPSKTCDADIYDGGGAKDDFGKYVFWDEFTGYAKDAIQGDSYIDSYTVDISMETTNRKWQQGDSIQDFIGHKSMYDPYADVVVHLKYSDYDDVYAQETLEMFNQLVDLPCAAQLDVYDNTNLEICSYQFNTSQPTSTTAEAIKKDIEWSRDSARMLYADGKALPNVTMPQRSQ
jgi:hypothetical protein